MKQIIIKNSIIIITIVLIIFSSAKAYSQYAGGIDDGYSSSGTTFTFPTAATITTESAIVLSDNTVNATGNIIALGSANPTQHGFCWNTSWNPNLSHFYNEVGEANITGIYTTNISGLADCRTYYIRAYATNEAGSAYGNIITFTTSDITPPQITSVHEDLEISAGENCNAPLPDFTSTVIVTDNCVDVDQIIINQTPSAGTIISGETNIVTITFEDPTGNYTQISFNVAVVDDTNPVITSSHSDIDMIAGANCHVSLPDFTSSITANDNCTAPEDLEITQTPEAGSLITGLSNTVTLKVEDEVGNIAEVSFNFAVEDNMTPVISSTHNDQIIGDGLECEVMLPDFTEELIATDNCTPFGSLIITQIPVAGTLVSGASNIVTLKVEDASGNYAEISFNVAVNDTTIPEIISEHNDLTIDLGDNCQAVLPDFTGSVEAFDNCTLTDDLVVTQIPVAGTLISGSENPVTIYVTDLAGNKAEVIFNIVLEDLAKPIITSNHMDLIIDAGENCQASMPDFTSSVTAFDNCTAPEDLVITQTPVVGTLISGQINTVTISVMDESDNITDISFNAAVEDNTQPLITSTHDNQVIADENNCEAILPDYTVDVVATDNCSSYDVLIITQTPVSGTVITGANNFVTLLVEDENGNVADVSFFVSVMDETNPEVISIHNDLTIDAGENCQSSLPDFTGSVLAIDNCTASENLIITQSPEAGTLISEQTNTVTIIVEDQSGNYAEVSFNVAVVDNTNPTITCVGNKNIVINAGETYYTVQGNELNPISVSDNCGIASLINDFNDSETLSDAIIPLGTTTIEWSATDESGNNATCLFDVTVTTNVSISNINEGKIHVYPNPTNGFATISLSAHKMQSGLIVQIIDINGKIISSIMLDYLVNDYRLDLSQLQIGTYYIRIYLEEGVVTKKVVKQ